MKFMQEHKDLQRGQAIVLIALAFVGLAAFIGLATDTGILFSSVGALRRAVDAAALSASNQFREGQSQSDMEASARQLIKLNLPNYDPSFDLPGSPCDPEVTDCIAVRVQTCANDVTLCPPGSPPKKLVRVEADMRVNLAFLPIIGYDFTVIRANAISEAGSVDLVLVIDTSPSMAYDLCSDGIDNDEDGEFDDCIVFDPPNSAGPDGVPESDVQTCTDAPLRQNQCEPFATVKEDAKDLVRRMYFPYDRVSIVGFARTACDPIKQQLQPSECEAVLDLQDAKYECHLKSTPAEQEKCVIDRIDDLQVELEPKSPPDPDADCLNWEPDPSGCTSTNTGDGLRLAGNQYGQFGREDAVWVVVLLSDGVANAGLNTAVSPPEWICPSGTWLGFGPPFCQDGVLSPSLAPPRLDSDPDFDAEDHARKMALFVGCPNEVPAIPGPCSEPGNGARIFTIGLGEAVVSYDRGGDPTVGGELLQFIAAVADGDPSDDPCAIWGPDRKNCGNYFFVEDVSELEAVFEEIASLIYTKLNH